ncbi:MAG: AAA family ATPase [Aeromonas sp.]|nr:AAA family ATPase [Aeromonas sp.]
MAIRPQIAPPATSSTTRSPIKSSPITPPCALFLRLALRVCAKQIYRKRSGIGNTKPSGTSQIVKWNTRRCGGSADSLGSLVHNDKNIWSSSVTTLNEQLLARLDRVILGKPHELRLALCCLLAQGHLLIEDLPGMGKTTLAHALATLLGLSYQRVQFTSDLLPADLLGLSIFDAQANAFSFHPGPLFSQVLLADEINRGSPRTQSALLEAMAERQISIDGVTRPLPAPFFVIATQNPQDQAGTFPLPESQLDRFMMRIELGYPSKEAELQMLLSPEHEPLTPLLDCSQLKAMQQAVTEVQAAPPFLDYLLALVQESRQSDLIPNPLSPRASRALLAAAKAWAFLDNRNYLLPDDLQAVFPSVAEHRMRSGPTRAGSQQSLSRKLLTSVDPVR